MPRATRPDEAEVQIRYERLPSGERRVDYAVSFIVLFKDQFGTLCIAGQDCGELLPLLHPNVVLETRLGDGS